MNDGRRVRRAGDAVAQPGLSTPIHDDAYAVIKSTLAEFQDGVRKAWLQQHVHCLEPGWRHESRLRSIER